VEQIEVAGQGISPATLLFASWAIGTCAVALGTIWQFRSVRKLVRQSAPNRSPSLANLLLEEARGLGIRRVPDLRMSSAADGPFLSGIWRPTIVLPVDSEGRFSTAELRGLLAHELAHHKRRDLVWNLLPTAVTALFYFHPCAWLLRRSWGLAQESASDELVLQARRASSADYARLLVKCASQQPGVPRATFAAAGVLGNYRNLERRIMAMARVQLPSTLRLCVAAALLALVATPTIVPWQLIAQEQANSKVELAAEPTRAQIEIMRQQSTTQLMQLALALHGYHDAHKAFPTAAIHDGSGKALLSWRVAVLPYLGPNSESLYKEFDLTKSWDSPQNRPLINKMPDVFRCPASKSPEGTTVYQAPRGDQTVFPNGKGVRVRDITDGTSNTIAIVEVNDESAVPWTKPEDWKFDPANPARGLGGHFENIFVCVFCDGARHEISTAAKPDVLNALFSRKGGELMTFDGQAWTIKK
jgi:beta-lactamase regulating signal transducer with metallopeptidase domain